MAGSWGEIPRILKKYIPENLKDFLTLPILMKNNVLR
jgi:hypothetical protein